MKVFVIHKGFALVRVNVHELNETEIKALPKFVCETLHLGCLAVHNGHIYGISVEHICGVESL